MIKNVVFDFGQVMVKFDPLFISGKYTENDEDALLLAGVLFDRLYWDRLDIGSISDDEVICECKKRLPDRLHSACENAYYGWVTSIPEIDGMSELVNTVREKFGRRVFLLSNISRYFVKNKDSVPSLSLFEKCIFSAEHGTVKPERRIFEILLDTCGILPEETVFIDDSEKNLAGAEAIGIKGILFKGDACTLMNELEKIL